MSSSIKLEGLINEIIPGLNPATPSSPNALKTYGDLKKLFKSVSAQQRKSNIIAKGKSINNRGRIRTHNIPISTLFKSPAPYPLGYTILMIIVNNLSAFKFNILSEVHQEPRFSTIPPLRYSSGEVLHALNCVELKANML